MATSSREEYGNAISHALGAVLSIPGTYLLYLLAMESQSRFAIISVLVYGFSMFFLFTASALYHWYYDSPRRVLLRKFDHIGIYVLIAGTYTPFSLVALIDGNGPVIFCVIWALALAGTIYKIFLTGRFKVISISLYLGMGYLIMADIGALSEAVTSGSFYLILLGGAFYTVGSIFYSWRSLTYNHFIWHLFVLGGAFSHYLAVIAIF